MSTTRRWCTMAGAARATGRSVNTLGRWLVESRARESWKAGGNDVGTLLEVAIVPADALDGLEEALPAEAYFAAGEVQQTARTVGKGRQWRVELAALQRVHLARGGVYWSAEAAHAVAALPPAAREERADLLSTVAQQARELEELRARLALYDAYTPGSVPPRPARVVQTPRAPRETPPQTPKKEPPALPLPEGWEAFSGWARRMDIDFRSASRLLARGVLPPPLEGSWHKHGGQTRQAYDPELALQAETRYHAYRDAYRTGVPVTGSVREEEQEEGSEEGREEGEA